ncbi:MAG TPA: isoprenylcysteine carboxylmethyltransferase family protein [Gammaproteobacteria bacterium]|nr:isoprenylcysteine carboxylmethyltransferase family protein [Gammaproteobacteria bacterium]
MKSVLTTSVRVRLLIWLVLLIGGAVAGVLLDLRLWPRLFANPWWHLASFLFGVLLLRLVFRVSRVTGRTLARHGRIGELPRMETNRLVTSGPYACMRHPMHLGLLLFPWSLALLIGSPAFLLIVAPLEMIVMVLMVLTLEEHEALRKFGDAYVDYRHRVPAFSLRPDCLRRLLREELDH